MRLEKETKRVPCPGSQEEKTYHGGGSDLLRQTLRIDLGSSVR